MIDIIKVETTPKEMPVLDSTLTKLLVEASQHCVIMKENDLTEEQTTEMLQQISAIREQLEIASTEIVEWLIKFSSELEKGIIDSSNLHDNLKECIAMVGMLHSVQL